MPTVKLSVDEFVRDALTCGLLTAADIEPLKATLPEGGVAADPTELARKLVAGGKLTKYQAANALQGKARKLVFGDYVLLGKIGSGGMGDVFKAEHRRMKRIVALKMLPAAAVKSPESVRRFQQEVQAAARLEHPNIVTAHDAGEAHGVHFLVMQYVDGRDLASLVAERGPLPVFKAVEYIVQAARGLAYAHAKGVVHRDVKPANLLVNSEETVKILDLGIAKLSTPVTAKGPAGVDLTMSGDVMGTADYMSPEQAEDSHQADARSDIYSLGCTLYFLLTGEAPYRAATAVKTIVAHREQGVPSLLLKRPDVSPALDHVFARMVAKKPAERFQSMPEVIAAFEPFARGAAGAVNAAWAEPVRAQMESPTSLSASGANETVSSSGKPSSTLIDNTVVQKTWGMTAKIMGALFGTVVAPIVVAFILKYLDTPDALAPATNSPPAGAVSGAVEATPVATTAPTISTPSITDTAPKPMAVPELLPGKAVDLLAAIDLKRDAPQGNWTMRDGALQMPASAGRQFSMLRLPVDPPSEYDVNLTLSRPQGSTSDAALILVFALDGHQGGVMMDGPGKAKRFWGVEMIDGKPLLGNGTAVFDKARLTTAPSRVVVKVRHDGVAVMANDTPVLQWEGSGEQLSLHKTWPAVGRQPALILLSHGDFNIQQLTLVPGGAGSKGLFNGVDLTGWTTADLSRWRVNPKPKTLTGVGKGQPVWLFTEQEFGDVRLSLEFKMAADTNAGVAIRAEPTDKEPEHLQIELRNDVEPTANQAAGTLLNGGVAKQRHLAPSTTPTFRGRAREWNDFVLDLHNNRLRVWINGDEVQDVELPPPNAAKRVAPALKRTRGRIGLQILSGQIHFRNIVVNDGKP
jgi:serine/threonine protein kinase